MFYTRAFNSDNILAIATMDYQAGRFAEAERGCRAVLKVVPDDASALYLLGLTEVQAGSVEAGVAHIETAIAQDSGRVDRACGYAAVLARLRRLDEAVAILGRTAANAPENAEVYRQLVGTARALSEQMPSPGGAAAAPEVEDDRFISVVVCSIDVQKATRIREHYEAQFQRHRFEVIQIGDARSLCEGYNRGFAKTRGDIIIFCHDDIEIISPDFPARLLAHLRTHDVVGVAGTTQLIGANWNSAGWPRVHGCVVHRGSDGNGFFFHCFGPPRTSAVEALDGLFIAAKREVCEAIEFDAAVFDGFHFYDLDFSYRASLAGFRIAVPWDILILHASWGRNDPSWQEYAQKFATKFGADKIVQLTPLQINWPIVQFSERADMIAFHRVMVLAQSAAGSHCGQIAAINRP
jgi:glycosyltransferase involved in cell wall biosynthesis